MIWFVCVCMCDVFNIRSFFDTIYVYIIYVHIFYNRCSCNVYFRQPQKSQLMARNKKLFCITNTHTPSKHFVYLYIFCIIMHFISVFADDAAVAVAFDLNVLQLTFLRSHRKEISYKMLNFMKRRNQDDLLRYHQVVDLI